MRERIKGEVLEFPYTKFVDNEYVDALYYSEIQIMHFIWKKKASGNNYRHPFLEGIEFSKIHPTKYVITDIRLQSVVDPSDRKWFQEIALPGAVENGLTKVGVVFEGDVFKRHYINILLQSFMRKGVPMKFFEQPESAVEWLLSE